MNPIQQPQQTREQFIESLFDLKKSDNFITGKEGVNKLIDGVQKGYDAIKGSYGSAGGNAAIRSDLYPFYEITNDGKKTLDALKLADIYEAMGLNAMKEVANKSDKESGDGRKTAAILYGAILNEGKKSKEDPMDIKRSLEECIPILNASIKAQSRDITENEVGLVASIASESKQLGAMFQEIYQKIGPEGIIELDNSNLPETFYEITDGVRLLNCGWMYDYMTNDEKRKYRVINNPSILITKQKLVNFSQIDPIIKLLIDQGKNEMVIFCDDIDIVVSQHLALLALQGAPYKNGHLVFKTLVIKAPTLWKDWLFEDFAKVTGATIVDPARGTPLKNIKVDWLGNCEKITAGKSETIVLGTKDVSTHIDSLLEEGTDDAKIRASRLKTKTAILKLGANSDAELSHLKGKALDGRNSSWMAMHGGIVEGGGVALAKAVKHLPKTVGGEILSKALLYPHNEIKKNLGIKKEGIVEFDNVYDASQVVINSLTNAISVAASALTTKIVIS